ncbi:ATP-binding protein [Paraliomyxa miuraensis]|uniref:ATP-binding protein n=1 Tax=Paraliomyxa miuraensis TaxID=376150 RepID=UPI002251D476|nr:ATP-binding protein [Paraliomyxa miuraensis]MCX4245630.1 ATP-binding protein [Paraliomyxa miuraensis]
MLVGPDAGKRIAVGDGVIVGRDVDGRGLIIDEGVSRRHMRVSRQADGTHLVEDLGSRNGTYVNGQRVEAAPLQSGDKVAVGSGTILLFTHNDRYEEQVVRAQKMQALGQLAGGVAHDFNNLVLAILGNVDYLKARDPNAPADVGECLGEIETAARRAAQLTRQLLSFARKREAVMEPVDIPALVHEASSLLRRTLPRNVDLVTDVEPGLGVMGDSAQLLQVLINAGINAGQAMPKGGRLAIRAGRFSMHGDTMPPGLSPGRYVRIEIEDSGVGMDSETLSRVFQPFFSTKPEGEGTGLGLSTAQSVVRDHGGEIDIRSRLAHGTRVSVFLPASEPSRPLQAADDDALTSLSGVVLLVDEEALVRNAARRLLDRFGLEALVASDVHEATLVIEHRGPDIDLVIVGDELPGGSLETLLPELRRSLPHAELLVSTSKTDPERMEQLERQGVLAILRKPYGARSLWGKVWLALQRRRARKG